VPHSLGGLELHAKLSSASNGVLCQCRVARRVLRVSTSGGCILLSGVRLFPFTTTFLLRILSCQVAIRCAVTIGAHPDHCDAKENDSERDWTDCFIKDTARQYVFAHSCFKSVPHHWSFDFSCAAPSRTHRIVCCTAGASSGIGLELAIAAVKCGASIAICARNTQNLRKTALKCLAAIVSHNARFGGGRTVPPFEIPTGGSAHITTDMRGRLCPCTLASLQTLTRFHLNDAMLRSEQRVGSSGGGHNLLLHCRYGQTRRMQRIH
jgi:hypothetical protein